MRQAHLVTKRILFPISVTSFYSISVTNTKQLGGHTQLTVEAGPKLINVSHSVEAFLFSNKANCVLPPLPQDKSNN